MRRRMCRRCGPTSWIEQVLFNLVHNVTRFTPPCRTVILAAGHRDGIVRMMVDVPDVRIPPDDLPPLIERFKAHKAHRSDGSGFGLTTVKHNVQQHGRTIPVESWPGEGATFGFTLPLGDQPAPSPRLSPASPGRDQAEANNGDKLRAPHAAASVKAIVVGADRPAPEPTERRQSAGPLRPYRWPERGSRASWRPSPRTLKAKTVSVNAMPGNVVYHQASRK